MEHFEQRRCEAWPERNLPSGGRTGSVDGSDGVGSEVNGLEEVVEAVELVELVLSVLDCRDVRRKGIEGSRKVGKTEGVACGSEGFRRKDIEWAIDVNFRSEPTSSKDRDNRWGRASYALAYISLHRDVSGVLRNVKEVCLASNPVAVIW